MSLTVVIPWYNSYEKSTALFSQIEKCNFLLFGNLISFVFVDDGSEENQSAALKKRFEDRGNVSILKQKNKGPGGAKNTGLKKAESEFVWFVDADDEIDLNSVVSEIESIKNINELDFIDFGISKKGLASNSMGLARGVYDNKDRKKALRSFGRLVTKVFRKDFIINNRLFFPENCIFEDNYLSLVIPFFFKRFFVSDKTAYFQNLTNLSVTRQPLQPRYYDRLFTVMEAYETNLDFCSQELESELYRKFKYIFFEVTFRKMVADDKGRKDIKRLICGYLYAAKKIKRKYNEKKEKAYVKKIISYVEYNKFENYIASVLESESEWEDSYNDLNYFKSLRDEAWGNIIFYRKAL